MASAKLREEQEDSVPTQRYLSIFLRKGSVYKEYRDIHENRGFVVFDEKRDRAQ
tara:strand:- start:2901 stop:3062 length:162 start_codon:yes stop_codon:yes gene_type:complete